jgi:hypothetical protein
MQKGGKGGEEKGTFLTTLFLRSQLKPVVSIFIQFSSSMYLRFSIGKFESTLAQII